MTLSNLLHDRLRPVRLWQAPSGELAAARLRYRGVLVALGAVALGMGAMADPSLRFVLLGGLICLVVWAALVPVPVIEAQAGTRQPDARLMSDTGVTGLPPSGPGTGDNTNPAEKSSMNGQSIIQALSDPALTLNRNLEVLEANAAAQDVFNGVQLGRHLSLTSRNPELAGAVGDALRQRARRTFVLEMRTPIERHLEGVATPLDLAENPGVPAPNDRPVILVYLRDLTEQDRLSSMRADFVANASHELRTPLASLKGFIETLQGPARNDLAAQGRFLEIMSAQAERMSRLVDDLLSLSRIEMRAHIPPNEPVNLNEIASSVVAALEPQARLAEITVTVKHVISHPRVLGDHDELVQAVQNLVQNAIKYGRQHGNVDVRLATEPGLGRSGTRLVLSVSDNGPGIAPEHLPRLTERFYRVNVATSRDRGGTGLGLAIVKHIITRHRGTLSISSTIGQGSTFKITLPTAPAGV